MAILHKLKKCTIKDLLRTFLRQIFLYTIDFSARPQQPRRPQRQSQLKDKMEKVSLAFHRKKMVRFFTTSQLKNKVAFGETYVKKCERGKKLASYSSSPFRTFFWVWNISLKYMKWGHCIIGLSTAFSLSKLKFLE